jgi:WG containing repeat
MLVLFNNCSMAARLGNHGFWIAGLIGMLFCVSLCVAAQGKSSSTSNDQPLVIVKNGKYGFIDHNGAVVIKPQYYWATDFYDGFAEVFVCGRIVSIDPSGKLLPHRPATTRLDVKREGEKVGFADGTGKFRIQPVYDDALPFSDGLAAVEVHGRWGFVDTSGQEVIPPIFKAAYYFRQGVASAETDEGNVLINKDGTVLAKGFQQLTGVVSEGRIPVSRGDKYGYLDLRGNVAIPLIYELALSFGNGMAPVKKAGKWGYIDRDGQVVIPFKFDEADVFASGLAPARIGIETGFINRSGAFAFHLAYQSAPGFFGSDDEGFLAEGNDVSRFFTGDNRFGYVNTSGKVIWGPTVGSPDHAPILGWDDEDRARSCDGIPQDVRNMVANFTRD